MNKKQRLEFYHERINTALREMHCGFSVSTEQQDKHHDQDNDKWAVVIRNNTTKAKEPIYTSYSMEIKETIGYLDGLKDAIDVFKIKECPIRKD